jgi:hypothetical protein
MRYIGVNRVGESGIALRPLVSLVSTSLSNVRRQPRPCDVVFEIWIFYFETDEDIAGIFERNKGDIDKNETRNRN